MIKRMLLKRTFVGLMAVALTLDSASYTALAAEPVSQEIEAEELETVDADGINESEDIDVEETRKLESDSTDEAKKTETTDVSESEKDESVDTEITEKSESAETRETQPVSTEQQEETNGQENTSTEESETETSESTGTEETEELETTEESEITETDEEIVKRSDSAEDTISVTIPQEDIWTYNKVWEKSFKATRGTAFEFDLEIGSDIGKNKLAVLCVYNNKTNFCSSLSLQSADFNEKKTHVTMVYNGDEDADVTNLGVKFGGSSYEGEVILSNFKVTPQVNFDESTKYAVYKQKLSLPEAVQSEGASYQWYRASSYTAEGTAIDGATDKAYTPEVSDIGGWLYCEINTEDIVSKTGRLRVVAADDRLIETTIKVNKTKLTSNYAALSNTFHSSGGSGSLDVTRLVKGGHFRLEYEMSDNVVLSTQPELNLQSWDVTNENKEIIWVSTHKGRPNVKASRSGNVPGKDSTYYAEYDYVDCVSAWGDEAFDPDLRALRIYCNDTNYEKITIKSVSWFGAPLSLSASLEEVPFQSGTTIFTWHVGGTFDATKIRKDSYFLVEYTGDENAVKLGVNSMSVVEGAYNKGKTLEPSETGATGNGYYSKFTAEDIEKAFGSDFRYIDKITVDTKSGKTANSKKLSFYEGNGELVDDISQGSPSYDDAIKVPWPRYADEPQDGIVVIGASITQNPLVTPKALEGAPYYNARGGWNAVLDRTDCITYGIGSQTTTNVANRFDEILNYDYKKIIIQCGNNDLGTLSTAEAVAALEVKNYTTMFDKVKAKNEELSKAGKDPIQVYAISLNPTGKSTEKLKKVNEEIAKLCENYDFVTRIDIYNDFVGNTDQTGTEESSKPDLVMDDGLHPVAAGYKIWAQKLKTAMASTDKADAALITLSYRISDTEKKQTVPGFASTKSAEADGYTVGLPEDTADNAKVKLYVTPHNLKASVTSEGKELSKDSYEDNYIEVILENGTADVEIQVQSEDSSKTETYKVHFANDGSSVEPTPSAEYEITDDTVKNWGGVSIGQTGVLAKGATLEFDLELKNTASDSQAIKIQPYYNGWSDTLGGTIGLAAADFTDNKAHISVKNTGSEITLTSVVLKFIPGTEYRGKVGISNMKINSASVGGEVSFGDAVYAVYDTPLEVSTKNMTDMSYQWYKASSFGGEGTKISGATAKRYTPKINEIGGWLYCTVTANGKEAATTDWIRVVADTERIETSIRVNNDTLATETGDGKTKNYALLSNTSHEYGGDGSLDVLKLVKDGYFRLEYESNTEITSIPQLELQTWDQENKAHKTNKITAKRSGSVSGQSSRYYAEYDYDDCAAAWTDEDFYPDLRALRVYCDDTNYDKITITKVSWYGAPVSLGASGEEVPFQSTNLIFTWHVGGTFDATRIREDSYFLVEYTGDADAVEFVAASSSYVVNGYNQYKTISVPFETGETGNGYYSIFTAEQIRDAFGSQFRYIDQFRVNNKSGKNVNAKTLYFFEGKGELVDDISKDGYKDAIEIPWPKYADEPQDGIVVIGASITQNPLVTPEALIGAPYYNAQGGWNAVLDRTDCITYGIGSQITSNVANRFDEILKYDYKKIIIQCGNNDLGKFGNAVVDEEVKNYTTMFEKVKAKNQELEKAGKDPIQVYTISLNPTNAENGIQEKIVKVNEAVEELGNKYDFVTRIDIYPDFKKDTTGSPDNPNCGEYHVNMDLVMADGLHPVAAGYKIWAQKLKAAMASADTDDATLITLSYRTSDTEKKRAVSGFASTKPADENGYTVGLPADTADDAVVKLFVTPHNLKAEVTADGKKLSTDSYGDDYAEVTLKGGQADVAIEVASESGTKTETYKVHLVNDGSSVEPDLTSTIEVTDDNVKDWPYIQIAKSGTLTSGTSVEFDVTIDNADFEKLGIWTSAEWNDVIGQDEFKPSDFTDNKLHRTITYYGEKNIDFAFIVVKATAASDYRGKVQISNVKVAAASVQEPLEPDGLEENIIFEGNEVSNDENLVQVMIQSSGFNMEKVVSGGYFYVEYRAAEKQDMKLALSEWDTNKWAEIPATQSGEVSEGIYYAKYSFAACKELYGSDDLSEVDAICAKGADTSYELTFIKWYGPAVVIPYELLYKGTSATLTGASQGPAFYFYTAHVGGDFDTATLREGSYFTLQYTSTCDALQQNEARLTVALSSASDTDNETDNHWVAVSPADTVKLENGNYLSTYTVEDCVKAFGKNVRRLDQIQVYTPYSAAADTEFVLKEMKYYAGDGDVIDLDGETRWTNKRTKGIGFIGDSICQNAMLLYKNWNTILDREDCVDTNWGIGGQNTTQISRRIDDMLASANYEKIVVLCGINDLGHGITKDQYIANYTTIIDKIHREQPATEVYAISILPTTPKFYPEQQADIADRNTALKALTDKYEFVTFVNCYPEFYDESSGYCKEAYVFDGLHPNETGYGVIAKILNPILGESGGSNVPSKTDLNALITECKEMTQGSYTEETWTAFTEALTKAEATAANEKATEEEIAAALKALQDAKGALATKQPEDPDNPPEADKTELNALIRECKDMIQGSYTDVTWKNFTEALAKAEETAANEKATKEEVAAALKTLQDARSGLKESEQKKEGFWAEDIADVTYTGKAFKPVVRVYDGENLLSLNKDYKVKYTNNTKAGTASITITGKGNYTGNITKSFEIRAKNLNDRDIVIDNLYVNAPKNKKAVKPAPVVTRDGVKLKANRDYKVECLDKSAGAYVEPGTYTVTVKASEGSGYEGSRDITIRLADPSNEVLMSKVSVAKIADQIYDGSVKTPSLTVKYKKNVTLILGEDYEAEYSGNTEIGTAAVTITGKGKYVGVKKVTFRIVGTELKANMITGIPKTAEYTGEAIEPTVTVNGLTEGASYSVEYFNNIEIGTASVIIRGINNYSGSIKKNFKITAFDLEKNDHNRFVLVSQNMTAPYAKGGSKPPVTATFNGKTLEEGVDYKLSYKNNKQAGKTGSITIKGIRRFRGSVSNVEFAISKQNVANLKATAADILVRKAYKYASANPVIVDLDGKKLAKNKDYTIIGIYADEKDTRVTGTPQIGDTLLVKAEGKGNYEGTAYIGFRVIADDKDISKATISVADQSYTGKALEPSGEAVKVTVREGGQPKKLTEGVHYEIVKDGYTKNIYKGKAKLTIHGIGEYGGTKVGTFRITAQTMSWADWYDSTINLLKELLY